MQHVCSTSVRTDPTSVRLWSSVQVRRGGRHNLRRHGPRAAFEESDLGRPGMIYEPLKEGGRVYHNFHPALIFCRGSLLA